MPLDKLLLLLGVRQAAVARVSPDPKVARISGSQDTEGGTFPWSPVPGPLLGKREAAG